MNIKRFCHLAGLHCFRTVCSTQCTCTQCQCTKNRSITATPETHWIHSKAQSTKLVIFSKIFSSQRNQQRESNKKKWVFPGPKNTNIQINVSNSKIPHWNSSTKCTHRQTDSNEFRTPNRQITYSILQFKLDLAIDSLATHFSFPQKELSFFIKK